MSAKITAALHEVMSKVSYVQKSGYNSFHKYKFAGEADLLSVLRPALVEAGLLLIPSVEEIRDIDNFGNTTVVMNYTLVHKDGDIWPHPIRVPGTGNDANSKGGVGDKGTYKAMTGANKYLLFKLFQIETGDEPEGSHEPQAPPERRDPPPKPPARTPNVERDRHFGNAADEIRSGQNGTPGHKPAPPAANGQPDPKAWANSDLAVEFLRGARADLSTVTHGADFSRWMQDFRWQHDAVIAFGSMVGKDGRTRAQYLNDLIADTQKRCRPADGLRGAA